MTHAGGRPPKFTEDAKAEYLLLLRNGHGIQGAAACLSTPVAWSTVREHRKGDPVFREACEEAEIAANEPVVLALYKAAQAGEPWAVKKWLDNRDSGNWQDRVNVEVSGTVAHEHTAPGLDTVLALQRTLEERRLALDAPSAGVGAAGVVDAESWETETEAAGLSAEVSSE